MQNNKQRKQNNINDKPAFLVHEITSSWIKVRLHDSIFSRNHAKIHWISCSRRARKKSQHLFQSPLNPFHWFIGKMMIPLRWRAPSSLILPVFKGIYPIDTHYFPYGSSLHLQPSLGSKNVASVVAAAPHHTGGWHWRPPLLLCPVHRVRGVHGASNTGCGHNRGPGSIHGVQCFSSSQEYPPGPQEVNSPTPDFQDNSQFATHSKNS